MIGSDIRTFGSDRIWVSDRICLNPYPIHIHLKKSDFIHIHIHYPINGFFYCFTESDRIENPWIRTNLPLYPRKRRLTNFDALIVYQQAETVKIIGHKFVQKPMCNTIPLSTNHNVTRHKFVSPLADNQGHDVSNYAGQMFQLCTTCV